MKLTGIPESAIARCLPDGRWTRLRKLAGIARHPSDYARLTDEDILVEFHRVVCEVGAIPTWAQLSRRARASAPTFFARFGRTRGLLTQYRDWLQIHQPNSPWLMDVEARLATSEPLPSNPLQVWTKREGTEYGAPLTCGALAHAPTNELGVVFLFGILAADLGFVVLALHPSYPDCEALRRVDDKRNRWQRVKIEFEYTSRNFRDHEHNPNGCDMIVCWEHDWPECPLEVLELRQATAKLAA